MTVAELILVVAGGIAIYFLLRPLQRWIEHRLLQMFPRRTPRRGPIIDVTDFASHSFPKKDRNEHDS